MANESADPFDKDLASALTLLKRSKTKRMFFALVLKGGSDGVLLVSRSKIATPLINQAKTKCGGSAVVKGTCYPNAEGVCIFETPKTPSPQWATLVKKLAKEHAHLSIHAEFRLGTDPDRLPDELPDEDLAAAAQKSALPPAPAATAEEKTVASGNEATAWTALRQHLEPRLLAAFKANQGDTHQLRTLFTEAVKKADAGGYDEALALGKKVAALLLTPVAAAPTEAGNSPAKQASAVWRKAREKADYEVDRLCDVLRRTGDPRLAEAADKLAGIGRKFKVDLAVHLTKFDQADATARPHLHATLLQILQAYQKLVNEDRDIAAADDNPFRLPVRIAQPTTLAALQTVQHQLDKMMVATS